MFYHLHLILVVRVPLMIDKGNYAIFTHTKEKVSKSLDNELFYGIHYLQTFDENS